MKRADLQRITNGMAQGRGEFEVTDSTGDTRTYNLVGAINEMENVIEDMEQYGLTYTDLSADQQEALDLGQQALHYYEDQLGNLLASFTANDGAVERDDGTQIVDLPNAATTAATTADLPSTN